MRKGLAHLAVDDVCVLQRFTFYKYVPAIAMEDFCYKEPFVSNGHAIVKSAKRSGTSGYRYVPNSQRRTSLARSWSWPLLPRRPLGRDLVTPSNQPR